MIVKEIEGSIKKTYIKKIRLHRGEYKWANFGDLISNDGPAMVHRLFKSVNLYKRIGVSNLKYEI